MTARIGVMGGTFDPIHHGHLVAAAEVHHAFSLDRVVFVPTGSPWQKSDSPVTPAEQRLEMTELAIASNDAFDVSRIEVDRGGPTYTVDTLRELHGRELHGRAMRADGASELYFITGADAILEILTWKDPDEALELATFVAVTRPGHELADLGPLAFKDRVVVLEIPALAISSTDIRRRVAEGRPIRYLVPDAVASYIAEHGLYRA
jgi:nicotinate-nucleotide adenylyltransferase